MDYHNGQKTVVDRLAESGLLEDGHMLKATGFLDQNEGDIEDFLGWELYAAMLRENLIRPAAVYLMAFACGPSVHGLPETGRISASLERTTDCLTP
jgi:hypothetical protein